MAISATGEPARRGVRRRLRPMAEINVTPFVDVMLVLLIVFMVTAPLLTVGVTVDLPETASSPLPGQDEPFFVRGDRVIDYGRVMEVVGAIHSAGFTRVALVTEFEPLE